MLDNLSRQDRELIRRGQFNKVEGMELITPPHSFSFGSDYQRAVVNYNNVCQEIILSPRNKKDGILYDIVMEKPPYNNTNRPLRTPKN